MSHSRETVTANPGPPAAGPYSHAVKANGLLFISGQVHLDPETGKLIDGSPGAKAERCLENLTIIAEAAGAKLENAVRVAVYVTDISVFAEMNEAYASYFEQSPPARTMIGVAALPWDDEVEMYVIIAVCAS